MTLDELKAHLNGLRTDEGWRAGWGERGYDVSDVCACLREMLGEAAKWAGADDEEGRQHFQAWVKHILAYANGELLTQPGDAHEGTAVEFFTRQPRRRAFEGDPEYEGDEGRQAWIRHITSCNPQKTFKQATADFHRHNGYWPKWDWPGLPRRDTDRYRRISAVPPELLYPGLPVRETGPIPD